MVRQFAASVAVVFVLVMAAGGCKKHPPPPAAKGTALHARGGGPTISCPGRDDLVKALSGANVLAVDCLAYNESMFWMAAALVRDEHAPDGLRLALITGSPYVRWALY